MSACMLSHFSHIWLFFCLFVWRLITLQYCGGFCHMLAWISHGCTCVPPPEPPSHLPPHPIHLSCPSALALSVLLYALNLDQWSISHMVIHMFQCWRRCGEKGTLLHCWWECNLVQPLWRTVWRYLKNLEIELSYAPAIPLLVIHTKETRIERDTCTPVFIAALFTIARMWKPPRCPSADECIQLFATPWTVAHRAPLSMGFSRQEYWSGLPFPPLGGSSRPWDRTCTSHVSCIGRQVLYD